ncbi:MAG: GIY-YIG nuclease family protein [Kiritimatiellia bacterium]
MFYVYILQSISSPEQTYVGFTEDLRQRIACHNQGRSAHTSKFVPWGLKWYCAFPEKKDALEFENYLKSHSGKAFASKRLMRKSVSQFGVCGK